MDYYKVNGVDILPYIADGGLQIDENDLDSEDAGRTLDGRMYRGLKARKDKHSLKCRKLTTSESSIVLGAISANEFVTVDTNIHPKYGTVIKSMYNSSRTACVYRKQEDGSWLWDGINFSLIER